MKYTTEDDIELFNLEILQKLGYSYLCGYDTQPNDSPSPTDRGVSGEGERDNFTDVVLLNRLENAVRIINPDIPQHCQQQAIRELLNIASPDLINNNETFYQYLTAGITVEYQKEGETRGEQLMVN